MKMQSSNYNYYKFSQKLIREMLATCPEASIYEQHVLVKAKKQIAQANRLAKKVSTKLEKYKGVELSQDKETSEIIGIIRAYEQLIGEKYELDKLSAEELVEVVQDVKDKYEELVRNGEATKATVFMRDKKGNPIISSHMILGNIKEILKIMTNATDEEYTKTVEKIFKSKVQVGEALALDLKIIEEFLVASQDITRKDNGDREVCERPIRFTDPMGKTVTAIAQSEQLPTGTIFTGTFRIRKGSLLDKAEVLERILDYGKNLGLGAWRGSGNKGAFLYKLEYLPDFKEKFSDGWK